ncbi:aspartyl protease family protein [Neolewinella agarilytica]|uniref:Aspartyl protease n=1 Tax=Neolewinella agarilytica TaxID=478744 RepID=A0A1H9M7S9_9BACT|nr:aspartyl protease family protein [Neolewinella agarilytica]SER19682.1 Aspartyl protease [Neolewinella agarilytica]
MSLKDFHQLSLPSALTARLSVLVILAALTLVPGWVKGQRLDLKRLGKGKTIQLPFELVNDFIVINVLLDNVMPLRFIVDTGAENTVLLEKEISDLLQVNYQRTFNIRGADVNAELTAYLATGVDLRLADALLARNRSMLVLEENYFNFQRIIGSNIQGILGADFLMRFVVEIDYRKGYITLHEPRSYKPGPRHVEVPAGFIRNRAYLNLPIAVSANEVSPRKLLLDSGAGLTLLIHTFGDSTSTATDLPALTVPTYIGNGLGGSLEGSVGRSRAVRLAGRELNGVVTYFQPLDTAGMAFLNDREGIVGNRILKRFNVVIDYIRNKVYFKPEGGYWKRRFRFDRSGMSIIAGGQNLRTYNVANIVPGSPADEAGIRVGDRIVAMNGTSVSFIGLGTLIRKLEGKVGKKIKIRYERDGKYNIVEFRLRSLI